MKRQLWLLMMLMGLMSIHIETSGQKLEMKWGSKVDAKYGNEILGIVGQDNEGFYLVKAEQKNAIGSAIFQAGLNSVLSSAGFYVNHTPNTYKVPVNGKSRLYVEKCDKDCKPIFSTQLDLPSPESKDKDMIFESMMLANEQLYMFTSFYNKKADYNYAFVSRLDEKGKVKNYNEIDKIQADKKKNAGNFDFILSKDSTKILVFHNEPYEKKEKEKFAIKILDKEAKLLWERRVELPYRDKDVEITKWILNNEGKVFVLGKYQEGKREKKGGKPNYNYFILSYEDATTQPVEYLISLGKDFISDITFNIDPKGDLVCAGLYSERNSVGSNGAFYLKVDSKTKEVITKNQKEFDRQTREQLMSKGRAKRGKEAHNFELRDMVMKEDGGAVLIGEQHYVIIVNTQTKYGNRTDYHYYYNTIMVVNINADGSVAWTTAIPKWQHTMNDNGYYSSFAMGIFEDKMVFVFNDNRKNLTQTNISKIKPMTRLKKSHAIVAVIDGQGNVSKSTLMENKNTKGIYLRPKVHLQTGEDQLILVAKKTNGDYMLGSLRIK